MLLQNSVLSLRAVEPEDLDMLYKWENDTSLWIHGNTLSPYSKLTLRQYIIDSQSQDIYQSKQLRLMIETKHNSNTIGTIDLYDFDAKNLRAGIGILIDKEARGNKYASQSLMLIKEYAFSFLALHQLYAYILVENEISIKLFEKAGYRKSGKLKDWIQVERKYKDVYLYQLING